MGFIKVPLIAILPFSVFQKLGRLVLWEDLITSSLQFTETQALFISHRLASTRFCDRILYLEHGAILEEGTHEELLQAGGAYAQLFDTQSRYYQEGRDF